MPSNKTFEKNLRINGIDEKVIKIIMGKLFRSTIVLTKQEAVDFFVDAMEKAEKYIDFDTISKIMFDSACCKSGKRNKDCKLFYKENRDKSLVEKVNLLSSIPNMGKPILNDNKTITTGIYWQENKKFKCACWNFKNHLPKKAMPLSYCLCCAGHFQYHYQNALGEKLKIKKVISSPLNSNQKNPCEFIYMVIR